MHERIGHIAVGAAMLLSGLLMIGVCLLQIV